MPIYFGMMLLAKTIFWNSYFFSSLPLTSMTLFSLLQMDSVLDIFKVLIIESKILGVLYMIFFWIILFAVSRRIFIVLIEDVYVLMQIKSKNSFVLNHLNIDVDKIQSEEEIKKDGLLNDYQANNIVDKLKPNIESQYDSNVPVISVKDLNENIQKRSTPKNNLDKDLKSIETDIDKLFDEYCNKRDSFKFEDLKGIFNTLDFKIDNLKQ